jgi:predicted ATPase/DNA-binding winged helix-turn-helix (wHTH) protein
MTVNVATSRETAIAFGPFVLNPTQRVLLRGDRPVRLGSRAREILICLVERAGTVVSKNELIKRVWPETIVEEGTLRVHIASLRKILGEGRAQTRYVENVTGHGYRFVATVTRSTDTGSAQSDSPRTDDHALPALLGPLSIEQVPAVCAPMTRRFGRQDVVATIADQLQHRRLMTIVGPGGMGKTTVAWATADFVRNSYPSGVCFVDLGSVPSPRLIFGRLAAALGLATVAADPVPYIMQFLQAHRMLIVLDNCEHVIDAAALLAEKLLSGSAAVRILATSREPLRVQDESVLRLAPLELPPLTAETTAAEALRYPAIQLFAERAAACLHHFRLADCDVPTVVDICRKLDGLPLAIELAAARVDVFGIRGLAACLNDRLGFLTRGHRTAVPRHRTLRATLDWSYELLPATEQTALRRLSVFAGRFAATAAGAIICDSGSDATSVLNILTDLAAKSLITVHAAGDQVSYQLLNTSRAYAAEKLQASAEVYEIKQRHARLCCSWGDAELEWEPASVDERDCDSRRIDDVRAALNWCFSREGDTTLGVELTAKSAHYWFQLSFLNEYRTYLERALELLPDAPVSEAIELRIHAALGDALVYTRGSGKGVTAAFRRTLAIATRLGTNSFRRRALWGLWVDRIIGSDYQSAAKLAMQFQSISEASPDPAIRLTCDRMLALSLHLTGDHDAARYHVDNMLQALGQPLAALSDRASQFDHRVTARALLARILWIQGYPDQAMRAAGDCLELAATTGHTLSHCYALTQAAGVALWAGNMQAAADWTAQLLECAARHSLNYWQSWGQCLQVAIRQRSGDRIAHLRLTVLTEDPLCSPLHLEMLATMGEDLATEPVFARAEDNRAGWSAAELLRVRAQRIAAEYSGNFIPAQQLLQRSLAIARRQGALSWELRTSVSLARLWQGHGRIAQARKLLRSAMAQFTEGFETRDFFKAKELLQQLQDQADDTPARVTSTSSRQKQLLGPGRNVPVTRMDFILPLLVNAGGVSST